MVHGEQSPKWSIVNNRRYGAQVGDQQVVMMMGLEKQMEAELELALYTNYLLLGLDVA